MLSLILLKKCFSEIYTLWSSFILGKKCFFEIHTHTFEKWEKLFQEKLVLAVSQVKIAPNLSHYLMQVFIGSYAPILLLLDKNLACLQIILLAECKDFHGKESRNGPQDLLYCLNLTHQGTSFECHMLLFSFF
jgi:hypothetical protein